MGEHEWKPGDRVEYTRHSDGTKPQGVVVSTSTTPWALRTAGIDTDDIDNDDAVAVSVRLDWQWVVHVGHPVTIDARRLRRAGSAE
jgi:hypothetical protein